METNEFDQLEETPPQQQEQEPPNILDTLTQEERHQYMIEKMKVRNKLLRYKELFPHILQNMSYRLDELDKMELRDLEYLLEETSIAVNTRNSSGLTKMLYFESVRVVEMGGNFIGLKINGLQQALKDNQAIHDCLNELSLKYESDMYLAPEIRLLYLTSSTVLQLHKLNSTSNVIQNFLQEKVPEQIKKEFEDL